MRKLAPIHLGKILRDEFLRPLGITQYRLAMDLKVPQTRAAAIVKSRRRISADTALRLSRNFRMSDRFFINLQAHYDLEIEKMKLGTRLEREVEPRPEPMGARGAAAALDHVRIDRAHSYPSSLPA